ncbi:hypothetical protein ACFLWX_03650 [Chloroflexota bacterium]
MKLGLALLIIGFLLIGGGIFLWLYADPSRPLMTDITPWYSNIADAAGIGVAIFGGGLVISGIVRMVVKR